MEQLFTEFFEAISPALQTLLLGLASALVGSLTAWVLAKFGEVRASMSSDKQYILDMVARMAVQAAEQVYTDNAEKRAYAIEVAETALAKYGVKLDLATIEAAIEAAVYQNG